MNDKKKTSGRPKTRSAHKDPVVREVKVSEVTTNNENDEDKKLIIVIAVAILIIIGTIIGLLVGCQKEEDNGTVEENKTDDVVVPITKDDDEDTTEDTVVRTTTSSTTTKYQITYILNGEKVYTANIAEGKNIKKHTPSGYEKCSYYADSEHTQKFDFSVKPTDDTKVYLVCTLKEYSVTYKDKDGTQIDKVDLKGKDTEDYTVEGNGNENFLGWSKNGNSTIAYKAGQKIDVNSNLTLTAVYGATTVVYKSIVVKPSKQEMEVTYGDEEEPPVVDEVIDEELPEEPLEEPSEANNWGYSSNVRVDNMVEVGYTQEEVDNYTLPSDPSEVGLETPTYFVPVDQETDTSRVIVSDDTEEVGDRQIRLGDVEGRTPDWYTPAIDDNVEEKDCEFQGWSEPSDYKPSTSGDNNVDAIYTIPEEDQEPPKQESSNNNSSGNDAPVEEAPAPVETVE